MTSNNITKNTLFSVAIMEWFINGDLHTKQFMRVLYKYYKMFTNNNINQYGIGLETWLQDGAKRYRNDYDCNAIAWCGIVAYIANDMNQLKRLLKRVVKATNNTEASQKYCEMIAVAIYTNIKYKSKEKTLNTLKKFYNYEPCTDLNTFKKDHTFSLNAKYNTYAGLNCFFHTQSYIDSISYALQLDSQFDIIACIAGMLSESLYSVPENLSHYMIRLLPQELINTIYLFYDFNLNPLSHKE